MSFSGSRRRMADAQGGLCPWCLLPLPDDLSEVAVDHIIPRCRGGPDASWNRQILHFRCNSPEGKGDKLTDEARELAERRGLALHEPLPRTSRAGRAAVDSRRQRPIPPGVTQAAIHALRRAGHEVDEEVIHVIILGILPSLERYVCREADKADRSAGMIPSKPAA